MTDSATAQAALAAATALHLGFQATVTLLTYPALADTGRTATPEAWARVHDAHSRRITPLVAVVYGALLVTGAWSVATGPGPAGWVSLAAVLATFAVTAAMAAPTHGRLARPGADRGRLLDHLLRVDRLRLLGGLVAALAAAGAVVT